MVLEAVGVGAQQRARGTSWQSCAHLPDHGPRALWQESPVHQGLSSRHGDVQQRTQLEEGHQPPLQEVGGHRAGDEAPGILGLRPDTPQPCGW
eukprot:13380566-Heterocapsa_arctica.AAC.1